MKFIELPDDIKEKVSHLAKAHPITIHEATHYYLMGGDHAETLCQLRTMRLPEEAIKMINDILWKEKNKELWSELNNQTKG